MTTEAIDGAPLPDRWDIFERCRRRLFSIAMRRVGTAEDAEDLVQETALRWLHTDPKTVRTPEGWLVAVVTRLAIDRLRRTAKERHAYLQAGHPGAVGSSDGMAPDGPVETASHLSRAFLVLRERLEPAERTAFALREMFDCDYDEIARVLGKSEVACRQVVHRARQRVRQNRSRLLLSRDATEALAQRFLSAVSAGDREAVLAALTDGATDGRLRPRRAASHGAPAPDGSFHRSVPPASGRPWRSGVTSPAA